MDDLIVFSNSAEDHQKHLIRLLEVLSFYSKYSQQKRKYIYHSKNVLGLANMSDF
jgi:hypothetical protein